MFVTLEGPEGAGKSTLIASLAMRLRSEGYDVVTTREPGAGSFGASVRRILLEGDGMSARAELFLFLADRAQHVESVIRPALAMGQWVLCDRFADSTLVYQSFARGLDEGFVVAANSFATGNLVPDRTLLLDLDVGVGLGRLRNKDRMDAEPVAFHERVRSGFLELSRREPQRWRVLDAALPRGEVFELAWRAIFE